MIQLFSLTISTQELINHGINVHIYRGDLEHQSAPGNKWHKLKYNIKQAQKQGATHLISFGGPYSNHLHALANTCHPLGLTPVAVVRGELHPALTPTLRDFVNQGGVLWPSARCDYRQGMDSALVQTINDYYPNAYWIPEGGSNALGVLGCYDWAQQIIETQKHQNLLFDTWVMSAGTGATCGGFLAHPDSPNILVFPALKKGSGLLPTIHRSALSCNLEANVHKLAIIDAYHHGGYAKLPNELKRYIANIHRLNPDVMLDPVYTAKVVYGLEQEIKAGNLTNKNILIIHTGGLQGWSGFQPFTE